MKFGDPFDEQLALQGPPAIFTPTPKGELKLDLFRTRDAWQRTNGVPAHEVCHCLFRDHATGYVQYVLATSPELCAPERADVARYPSAAAALEALSTFGRPPVARGPFP
jgi:hypothetical protein